ncbi:hypothetical protein BOTBODRAFT_34989 [Botryobasidium botryosum FD-172 SS1]|uniref:Importin N-terminal domain-containing protein n=1 Tax=Botryobasidium botryosum (strain FD-172 SS1) TaxID=930990 RepID=A0A067MJ80_BOTB1|nr:hypothetical protein BOTBODRAFT_34989 [Botryobasidium botryosum FD-172 SS1]
MNAEYVQKLHALLLQTSAPDTALIKAATAQLNQEYYKSPDCIPALFEIIASAPEQTIRQLAAVELRKRVMQKEGTLWIALAQDVRETIKSKIAEVIIVEQSEIVRHSTARVIATIAEIELPLNNWPALLPWLYQCATSSVVTQREIGVYVLYSVLENVVEGLQEKMQEFFNLFARTLQDPESENVRNTTVRALGTISQYIDQDEKPDIKTFQGLVPGMITVLGQAVETGNEEAARHGFDVFETLLILETPLLGKHIPNLVEFFLACGSNTAFEEDVRVMALNTLTWTIKYKKSKIQSLNLAKPILEGLLPIGAEEDPEDIDQDSPSRIAFRAIDALATALPPSLVFPPLHSIVTQYMASPNPALRKSAMMAFGVTVEGCSEFIRPHMKSLWPFLDAGFVDPDPVVRKAACIAFGCVCEWLDEECVSRHEILMPAIMNLMNDPASQSAACTALDSFLEILGPQILQYLTLIMERLAGLLETGTLKVKSLVTGAIGSAAHASKETFRPYFTETFRRLQPFLLLTKEGEELDLRGIAMDAVGTIAEAVGKDEFRPYFPGTMKIAFDGVSLHSARLRECSFLFFGVMARIFEDEFAPYLPQVVPSLLASCKQLESGEEGDILGGTGGAFSTGESSNKAIFVDENQNVSIAADDLDDDGLLSVNSAIAVEKEIAADTMGAVFVAVRGHFLPYLEPCTLELIGLLTHYYEGIRKAATTSLFEFIKTFYELSEPKQWVPGLIVQVPLHDKVRDLVNHIFPPLFEMLESEDDKTVVSGYCQSLSETLGKVGPGLVDGRLEEVCNFIIQILEQKSLCQQDPDQDDEDEEVMEDQAEFDSVLISTASDVVGSLASVLGPDFSQAFGTFLPNIMKYYSKGRSLSDRTSSIGCLGEIITGLKGGVTMYTEPILEHLFSALSDSEPEVRSNAAFATGVLVENTERDLGPQFMHLLGGLRPFFDVPEGSPAAVFNARDNAAGAVARLIIQNTAAVPLDQVLPVLISALPLKNDYLENRAVYRCIFHLFHTNPPAIMPYVDRLLPAFAYALNPETDQLGDEVREELIGLVRALNAEMPAKIAENGLGVYLTS